MLDSLLLALWGFGSLPFRAALGVIHVLEGIAEQLFLIGAMRTPPRAVHASAFRTQAFCESVKGADLAIGKIVVATPGRPQQDQDAYDPDPARAGFWLASLFPLFAEFRHAVEVFIPRRSAPPAARPKFDNAG